MLSLIIEIQSGIIRTAIIKDLKAGQPTFVDVKIAHIKSSRLMLETLSKVIEQLNHKNKISSVHVILSSPWISSFSKSIELHFDKERKITENLILNIIKEENNSLKKDLEGYISIEQKIFEIRSNGYIINDYKKLSSENLGLSFISTFSSNNLIKKINNILENKFEVKEIQYHSGLLLNSLAIRDFDSNYKDEYIHVNIHSEITDIIVIKNGKCLNISSFPLGIESFNRYMNQALRQNKYSTRSTIKLLSTDKLDDTERIRVQKIIDSFIKVWINQYQSLIISTFGSNYPRDVYLLGYDHNDHFKNAIESAMESNVISQHNPLDMYIISLRKMI